MLERSQEQRDFDDMVDREMAARRYTELLESDITTLRTQLAEAKAAYETQCAGTMSRMQENQTLKQRAERAEADNARLREALESEPELPGDMPDEMWDALRHADRETMTEVLRACVRTTKAGILRAYTDGNK